MLGFGVPYIKDLTVCFPDLDYMTRSQSSVETNQMIRIMICCDDVIQDRSWSDHCWNQDTVFMFVTVESHFCKVSFLHNIYNCILLYNYELIYVFLTSSWTYSHEGLSTQLDTSVGILSSFIIIFIQGLSWHVHMSRTDPHTCSKYHVAMM